MQIITSDAVIIGVDTHKDVHVAVALSRLGALLGESTMPATADCYRQLADWARDRARCTPSVSRAKDLTEPA